MTLTPEQLELLSAWLDGEVNAAERALAQALLERPEAKAYVRSLEQTVARVREHGAAKAPQGFATLVRQTIEGDFDGLSRPTSNQGDFDGLSRPTSNQIQALPQASWRMPLFAAAAAVLVAAGVLFSGVMSYQPAAPDTTGKAGESQDKNREVAATRAIESPTQDARPDNSRPSERAPADAQLPPKPQPVPGHRPGQAQGTEKGQTEAAKGKREETPDGTKHLPGGGITAGESEDRGEHQRHDAAFISFDDAATEISINASRRASISALYTDILSVASLHGEAELKATRANYGVASVGADFTLYRGVEVAIEEERVPELLAALERLIWAQGLGRVVVPGHMRRLVASELRYVDALQDIAEALADGEQPHTSDLERLRRGTDVENAPELENYRKPGRGDDPAAKAAGATLPAALQRGMVERVRGEASLDATKEPARRPSRVVRVLIRLQ